MAHISDLIQSKLKDHFSSSPETNVGALLRLWREEQGLEEWDDFVTEMLTAGGDSLADAALAYWDDF